MLSRLVSFLVAAVSQPIASIPLMSANSHAALASIYLSKQHQPVSVHTRPATSRSARLQAATSIYMPQRREETLNQIRSTGPPIVPAYSTTSSRPTSARSRPSSARPVRSDYSVTLSNGSPQQYQLQHTSPISQAHHSHPRQHHHPETNKFGHILDDMEKIFHSAMSGGKSPPPQSSLPPAFQAIIRQRAARLVVPPARRYAGSQRRGMHHQSRVST
jgi:hypothetical protein